MSSILVHIVSEWTSSEDVMQMSTKNEKDSRKFHCCGMFGEL